MSQLIQGIALDGKSSRSHTAVIQMVGDTLQLGRIDGQKASWPLSAVLIQPPIPGVRRVLKFPDGSRFETEDDAAISALEQRLGKNRVLGGVRRMESAWSMAMGSVIAIAGLTAAFLIYGLPAIATQMAHATPRSVLATFDRETVEMLEKHDYLAPTKLSAARQEQLQAEFRQVAQWAGGGYPYKLLLRDGDSKMNVGANAFALPNGTVVMTDQLVKLSKSDRELMGVLAHETGHVTGRHGLATVYQSLGMTLLAAALTGDLVSPTTAAAAVPATIMQQKYSRSAEVYADEVSGRYMLRHYGTTKPLQAILARLEGGSDADADAMQGQDHNDLFDSHPATAKRIKFLKELEQQNKK